MKSENQSQKVANTGTMKDSFGALVFEAQITTEDKRDTKKIFMMKRAELSREEGMGVLSSLKLVDQTSSRNALLERSLRWCKKQ
jgi:hypothetical protein